jgi:hypothetical protein
MSKPAPAMASRPSWTASDHASSESHTVMPSGPIKWGRLAGIVAFPSGQAVAVGSTSTGSGMNPLVVSLCSSAASGPPG